MFARLISAFAAWSQAFSIKVKILGLAAVAVTLMGLLSVLFIQARYPGAIGDGAAEPAAATTRVLVLAFLTAAPLSLASAYVLTLFLTRPVLALVEATRAVAAGDLAHRAPPGPPDEIGLLVRAFNEMVERLAESRRVREELLDRIINAQEEERKRIARELHDETSQAITSLLVGIRALEGTDPALVQARSAELRALASSTLADLHRLVLELRPRSLDELGLVAAVRRYTADFSQQHGIPVDLQTMGQAEARLPARVEICVYRIIQEALTNVARHAAASQVSVVLDLRPDHVTAVVEDDGCGFDPRGAPRPSGETAALGLHGMRERAALAGGTLTIESAPGSGTAVFVKIPLIDGALETPRIPGDTVAPAGGTETEAIHGGEAAHRPG